MKRFGLHAALIAALLVVLGVGSYAIAGSDSGSLRASLNGTGEVPLVVTGATGTFRGTLDTSANTLTYTLTYADVESAVQQAHIHIGQRFVAGGITLYLCTNLAAPAGVPAPPACPSPSGTVTGVLGPSNIFGPAAQGIVNGADAATDLAEWNQLERVLLTGKTYANVHSQVSPAGEIRGQIRRGDGGGD